MPVLFMCYAIGCWGVGLAILCIPFSPVIPLFPTQLSRILAGINDFQFDAFELKEATGGRPLSVLAFFLFKSNNLISHFDLHEARLARCDGDQM